MLALACAIPNLYAAWEWTNPEPVWWNETTKPPGYSASYTGYAYARITQGNGRLLGIRSNGSSNYSLLSSLDGQTWELLPAPVSPLHNLTFLNGEFILQGPSNTLLTSTDGAQWTTVTTNLTNLYGLAYGNGVYAAVTYDGVIWTSTDKTQWTPRTTAIPDTYSEGAITYANGLFVAITSTYINGNASVLTSSDGLTWNSQTLTGGFFDAGFVRYLNGQFIAGGVGGKIYTSPDGSIWTANSLPAGGWGMFEGFDWAISAAYGNGIYVSVGYKGLLLTSSDGKNWNYQDRPANGDLYSLAFFNGQFLAFGRSGTVIASTDGIHWQSLGSEPQANQRPSVRYANGQFIAVGERGSILTSSDGSTWAIRRQPNDSNVSSSTNPPSLYSSAYGSNIHVVVGESGTILTSSDLRSWTKQTSGSTAYLYGATYAAGQFVAVGANGTILTSPDGILWTVQVSNTTQSLCAVTQGPGLYVAVGDNGQISSSSDGITWTSRNSGTNRFLRAVTYAAGHYVAVGSYNTILTSPDGIQWTIRNSSGEIYSGFRDIAYGNGQFIVVPSSTIESAVWTSTDGLTWTPRQTGIDSINAITYGNGCFVGSGGDQGYLYRGVPLFLIPPSSRTINGGQPVTLAVTASGTGPFTYQWKKNGSPISGATSASYPIAAFTADDTGSYTVQVDSPVNTVTSTPALLELFADNDGDGVSNTWETANGFGPDTPGDVQTLDTDQDGVKDILEIFQGTNRSSAPSAYGLQNTSAMVDATTRQLKTRYRRSTSQTAVARTLQWSDDLALGFTSNTTRGDTTVSLSESVVDSGPGYEIVEVTTTVIAGTPTKLFFNLGLQPVE